MIFAEEVFGGSVPKNFFPAVEKGLREACAHGPLAGYPVVNLKAVLYDAPTTRWTPLKSPSRPPLSWLTRPPCRRPTRFCWSRWAS